MKKSIVFLALITAATMLFGGCGQKAEGEASVQSVSMVCGIGSTGLADRFAGIISPRSETEIKKDEEQVVSEVKVKAGDTVKKKQVLFTYDMEQTQLNLEKAELELEQLKNSLTAQQNEKAALEKERAKASQDQKLSYTLEIQEAETNILETNYNITTKEKEIKKLEETLKNLEVKSPVAGRIQSINEEGETDNYGNALPYITIVETGSYRVKGYVNETNAAALSEGTSVLLRSRVDDTIWHGTISSIDWENPEQSSGNDYYSSSSASDTTTTSSKYPFYVELDDDKGLILGQHVYIEPDYGQENQEDANLIQLPSYYLNEPDGSAWVWAQDDKGLLEKRSVTLGEYNEEMDTYPVQEGLTANDYIAFPEENLKEGMTCVEYDENVFDGGNGAGGNYNEDAINGEGSDNGFGEGAIDREDLNNGFDEGAIDGMNADGGIEENVDGNEAVDNGEAVE